MITKPLLPPKPGYVEVEVNGERVYRNVETGVLLRDEVPTEAEPTADELIDILLGVNSNG